MSLSNCAMTVNVPCRHLFCALCIIQEWATHAGSVGDGEGLGEFLCPKCDAPLLPIVDRGKRTMLNIPIYEDKMAQRFMLQMSEEILIVVQKYPRELRSLGGGRWHWIVDDWPRCSPGNGAWKYDEAYVI